MITRGIVESIISKNKYLVNIPIFGNTINGNSLKFEASLCTIPGANNFINVGDVVVVGFEDKLASKPIILGLLELSTESQNSRDVGLDLSVRTLNVENTQDETFTSAKLPENTTIGDVTGQQLKWMADLLCGKEISNNKSIYIGPATDKNDGSIVISNGGTTYVSGLAIDGTTGNLYWKGSKVKVE